MTENTLDTHPTDPAIIIASGLEDLTAQNPAPTGGFSPQKAYRGEGFSVTHVAFDTGIELPEHDAPVPILVQIAQGSVDFRVEGISHVLTQGAILHLPAHIRHSVHSLEPARVIVTFLG